MSYRYTITPDRNVGFEEMTDVVAVMEIADECGYQGLSWFDGRDLSFYHEEISGNEDVEETLIAMSVYWKLHANFTVTFYSEDHEFDYRLRFTPDGKIYRQDMIHEWGPWEPVEVEDVEEESRCQED